MSIFFHDMQNEITTLSEIKRVSGLVGSKELYGLFAYATQSGLAAFDMAFGEQFWQNTRTRWLFGFDYGRTQPQAVRQISEKPNSEVRIFDGAWIVQQEGFLPRRDYHPKTTFIANSASGKIGVVAGSGNFSSNGLKKSVEAGVAIYFDPAGGSENILASGLVTANDFWNVATPAEAVLDEYQGKWSRSFSRSVGNTDDHEILGGQDVFWIEAGYVTRNRGPNRPGNQIDFPRGMSRYFGLNASADLPLNSVIGEINFIPPLNGQVVRNLRLGNNSMEKITLPIPERHGFDIYDGKVLVFMRSDAGFFVSALEAADFEASFGDRLASVMRMGSGRRYGHIK
jgi:hypothetical protein